MFCPKCSQQQVYDEVRFCSRCGFQLLAVSELLKTDGLSFIRSGVSRERLPLIKRKELRSGAKLIFASFFLAIPSIILTAILENPFPLLLIPITFLLGLAQILYYFFFGESILPLKKQNQLMSDEQRFNFQPEQGGPSSVFESRSLHTSEFMRRPSITEPTANLMDNK